MDLSNIINNSDNFDDPKKRVPLKDIAYDNKIADISQHPSDVKQLSEQLPYVKRAIKYAEQQGWSVVELTYRQVLMSRYEGKTYLTLHEADIAYRKKLSLKSLMLMRAMLEFGIMITEDDQFLSAGVFQLRARYNKGIIWRNTKRSTCSPQDVVNGDAKISELEQQLNNLGLPLHKEELDGGFHREFMKPEWMNWSQFNSAIVAAKNYQPLAVKENSTL